MVVCKVHITNIHTQVGLYADFVHPILKYSCFFTFQLQTLSKLFTRFDSLAKDHAGFPGEWPSKRQYVVYAFHYIVMRNIHSYDWYSGCSTTALFDLANILHIIHSIETPYSLIFFFIDPVNIRADTYSVVVGCPQRLPNHAVLGGQWPWFWLFWKEKNRLNTCVLIVIFFFFHFLFWSFRLH